VILLDGACRGIDGFETALSSAAASAPRLTPIIFLTPRHEMSSMSAATKSSRRLLQKPWFPR